MNKIPIRLSKFQLHAFTLVAFVLRRPLPGQPGFFGGEGSFFHYKTSNVRCIYHHDPGDFVCNVHACVLSNNFVVYSAYWHRLTRDVTLLIKNTLDARVDLADDRLILVDIVVKNGCGWL